MPVIYIVTEVDAPQELCFDLSRSAEVHAQSLQHTREKVVDGRRSGLFELNDFVTFEAVHFGIRQKLSSKITAMEFPRHFRDEMTRGAFKRIHHDHRFFPRNGKTIIYDVFAFNSPLGWLGWIVDMIILKPYLKRILTTRNAFIKRMAESGEWKNILPGNPEYIQPS